ncbi:ATP-binding protein [Novosphingobium bradum]|uniref:histidine kinase n=1 Tax=Novosphingobium bradum TaxID=1737444 RepID=A0ABV7IZ46_9SPHN
MWLSYLRAAIIPLLVVEIGFLAIYWASSAITYRENIATIGAVSRGFLGEVARQQAGALDKELAGYAAKTVLLAAQTRRALDGGFTPSAAERARHRFDADGAIYSTRDIGSAASFYSAKTRPSRADLAAMLRLGALDPLMIDIHRSTPGVMSVYFNSSRSYNRIYPYIDAGGQYPHDMDIPSYNFYYLADARHDPQRKAVWTEAYVDPAGHGWMISSIAPVWQGAGRGERLAGVVGLDIGLGAIIDRLKRMNLPWMAYAVLVDREGRIIALPPEGEKDFNIRELTSHQYEQAIRQDSFKPDAFDLNRRADTRPLAEAMRRADAGEAELRFDGLHYASFATVPGTGWRLVVIAPAKVINAPIDSLLGRLKLVGLAMFAALLLFYFGFFLFLYRRARGVSAELSGPLAEISGIMGRIGQGAHRQHFAGADVAELDGLGRDLVAMGNRLGDAHERIVAQEQGLREANQRQQQAADQNARLVQIMSHELRTPLALIDSGAQIIERKAESLGPDDLRRRSDRLRGAVRRIAELIDKLVTSLTPADPQGAAALPAPLPVDLAMAVETASAGLDRTRIAAGRTEAVTALADPEAVVGAIRAALDNALRYSGAGGTARVDIRREGGSAVIAITDSGPGLGEAELAQAGQLFFRGDNAAGSVGAGVSLHLARRRLEESGGRLELERGDPAGLVVRIVLPLAGEGA